MDSKAKVVAAGVAQKGSVAAVIASFKIEAQGRKVEEKKGGD